MLCKLISIASLTFVFMYNQSLGSVAKHIAIGAGGLGFDSRGAGGLLFDLGSVKSDSVLPTARHSCDVFSELCCSGAKSRRWIPPLVTHFDVITRVAYNEDWIFF